MYGLPTGLRLSLLHALDCPPLRATVRQRKLRNNGVLVNRAGVQQLEHCVRRPRAYTNFVDDCFLDVVPSLDPGSLPSGITGASRQNIYKRKSWRTVTSLACLAPMAVRPPALTR